MTSTYDPDCDFCSIVWQEEPAAREVLRTESVLAFFPLEPATLGQNPLVPRVHVRDIGAADDQIASDLMVATLRVAAAFREAVSPDGLNISPSNGEAATQTVMHLQVHVVPRQVGDQIGRIWLERTDWSDFAKRNAQEEVQYAMRQP